MKKELEIALKLIKAIKDKKDIDKLKERVRILEEQHKPKTFIEREIEKEINDFLYN